MKKVFFSFAVALSILASIPAQASRARNLVMFTGDGGEVLNGGSFYYDDEYNIFYNPAYVNEFKNWGIIEKSNGSGNGSAQAGFVASLLGLYNIGLYMNRVQSLSPGLFTTTTEMKPVEIFFGADMGIRWGLGVGYAREDSDSQDLNLKLGAMVSDFEPFVNFRPMSKDRSATGAEIKNHDILVGTRYKWGEWIPYAAFRNSKSTLAGIDTNKRTVFGLGLARNTKISEEVRLNYSFSYWNRKLNQGTAANLFPIDFSVEADAAQWVTVRGGFAFRERSRGRLGATFHISKVDVDWGLGGSAAAENLDTETLGLDQGFFTALSIGYKW